MRRVVSSLLAAAAGCAASDPLVPHFHDGKLAPYEIGPPSILLSPSDEARLAEGEALMQAIVQDDGVSRRLVMVKDVHAPPEVITRTILNIDEYPRMIKGCDSTQTYEEHVEPLSGVRTIKTRYEISVSANVPRAQAPERVTSASASHP